MRTINSNETLAKRILTKSIEKFRRAYKVPRPKRIYPRIENAPYIIHVAVYRWEDIFNKACEIWVMTDELETKWNCIVKHTNMSGFIPCTEEWEMIQLVTDYLETWFKFHILGQSII